MVKMIGNDVWRGGQKIGWVEEDRIRAHDGTKLGYFQGIFVYGEDGRKLAYIEGDSLFSYGSNTKIPLEKVAEEIEGGVLSTIGKCAVYVLLGD